jgi:hypothetical protein
MAPANFEMGALLLSHTKQISSPPKEGGKANRFPEFGVGVLLFVFFQNPTFTNTYQAIKHVIIHGGCKDETRTIHGTKPYPSIQYIYI